MFKYIRQRIALKRLMPLINMSEIVQDALHVVETYHSKGYSPGANDKRSQAIAIMMDRFRLMGYAVFPDDKRFTAILNHKIEAVHASETLSNDTRYNDSISTDSAVYR